MPVTVAHISYALRKLYFFGINEEGRYCVAREQKFRPVTAHFVCPRVHRIATRQLIDILKKKSN